MRAFPITGKIEYEGEKPSRQTTADDLFARLTGRWVLQILMSLNGGQQRFNDLRRAIPKISANVLTARLRELEAANLVARTVRPEPVMHQVYELGPLAQELRPSLDHLNKWKARLPSLDPESLDCNLQG